MLIKELLSITESVDDKAIDEQLEKFFHELRDAGDHEITMLKPDKTVRFDLENKEKGTGVLIQLEAGSRVMVGGELVNPKSTQWTVYWVVSTQGGRDGFDKSRNFGTFDEATSFFKTQRKALEDKYL